VVALPTGAGKSATFQLTHNATLDAIVGLAALRFFLRATSRASGRLRQPVSSAAPRHHRSLKAQPGASGFPESRPCLRCRVEASSPNVSDLRSPSPPLPAASFFGLLAKHGLSRSLSIPRTRVAHDGFRRPVVPDDDGGRVCRACRGRGVGVARLSLRARRPKSARAAVAGHGCGSRRAADNIKLGVQAIGHAHQPVPC
jgi:hypothetical protein